MKKVTGDRITIRISPRERKLLEAEATAVGLGISAYVRHLVYTHQGRTKAKKEDSTKG